jgi:hypothetical protein
MSIHQLMRGLSLPPLPLNFALTQVETVSGLVVARVNTSGAIGNYDSAIATNSVLRFQPQGTIEFIQYTNAGGIQLSATDTDGTWYTGVFAPSLYAIQFTLVSGDTGVNGLSAGFRNLSSTRNFSWNYVSFAAGRNSTIRAEIRRVSDSAVVFTKDITLVMTLV